MSKRILLCCGIITSVLLSCSSVKRYKSASHQKSDTDIVKIDHFTTRLVPETVQIPGKNLWDLNASAQEKLLNILNSRYPLNEDFISSLSFVYGEPETEKYITRDYTRHKLKLILNTTRSRDYSSTGVSTHPGADRIVYLKYSIEIPDTTRLKFNNWNKFSTEYEELKIADISFSRSLEISGEAGIKEDRTVVDKTAGLGVKASISRKEDQEIRKKYLRFNGMLKDKRIEVEQEGTRERDLTGNTLIDISLSFDSFNEAVFIPLGLKDSLGNFTAQEKVSMKKIWYKVPVMAKDPAPVSATLDYYYVLRKVVSNANTFLEDDDGVVFFTDSVRTEITLLKPGDYTPHLFCIYTKADSLNRIRIIKDGKPHILLFRNYLEAEQFSLWLEHLGRNINNKSKAVTTGSDILLSGDRKLLVSDLSDAPVIRLFYKSAPDLKE